MQMPLSSAVGSPVCSSPRQYRHCRSKDHNPGAELSPFQFDLRQDVVNGPYRGEPRTVLRKILDILADDQAASREPLKAEGEWIYPVPPLAVPTRDANRTTLSAGHRL